MVLKASKKLSGRYKVPRDRRKEEAAFSAKEGVKNRAPLLNSEVNKLLAVGRLKAITGKSKEKAQEIIKSNLQKGYQKISDVKVPLNIKQSKPHKWIYRELVFTFGIPEKKSKEIVTGSWDFIASKGNHVCDVSYTLLRGKLQKKK